MDESISCIDDGRPTGGLKLEQVLADLIADGILSPRDAGKIRIRAQAKDQADQHPLVLVADLGSHRVASPHDVLTLEGLTVWLAGRANLPYLKIDPLKVDVAAVTVLVSYAYAGRYRILPVEVDADKVVVATAEPWVTEWREELGKMLHRKVEAVISNPRDITRYLVEFYALTESVKRAFGRAEGRNAAGALNLEQLVELGRTGKLDADDRYVVNIVDWLLQYAYDQRASDIHLEPRRDNSDIRFRIDGVLHPVYQLPSLVMGAVISRIKVLGRMDLAEKRRPQDGRLKTRTPSGGEVELRLSTMPTAFGEKMVMRIFDPEITVRSFEGLGLNPVELTRWKEMVSRPHGIILVTGPTGSGKTTTLYSTLKQIAKPEVNVCTVEDPIEMVEPRFNQMQVHHAIGVDFANGLRTLLRQDPDIIMVGEIRDRETAEMAVQAALTGHLVFSTLHTNDAPSAVVRLLDIGVPYYLLRATLLGVVAQRLVRTLCPDCKREGTVDPEIWQTLVAPWKMPVPQTAYVPCGCLLCRETGYRGRLGIYEILTMSPTLRRLVGADTNLNAIRLQAYKEGMHSLHLSGAQKVAAGLTTLEEVLRAAGVASGED